MNLNIAHIALTPLAGSPIRIVNALNKFTTCLSRLITLNPDVYGPRVYDGDLQWHKEREQSLDVLEKADILHFHHWLDLSVNHFGIDFKRYLPAGKKIVRQFHSTPFAIANGDEKVISAIVSDTLPKLVIAQHQERYFPTARLVPNIIPLDDTQYRPLDENCEHAIFFAPSVTNSAWYTVDPRLRWDTKGYPETLKVLSRVKSSFPGISLNVRTGIPHRQCLHERRRSILSVDDLVTGSYHLSSLEGLAQGVPTFAFLDARTQSVLYSLTGADHLPWVNCTLASAELVMLELLRDQGLRQEIALYSRKWFEMFWREQDMVQHYVNVYKDLFDNPESFAMPRFDLNDKITYWNVQRRHDLEWLVRKQQSLSPTKPFVSFVLNIIDRLVHKCQK